MKKETMEQIKEFTATLDRLNKGDVTLNSKISSMRDVIISIKIDKNLNFEENDFVVVVIEYFIGDTTSDFKLIQYP